MTRLYNCFYFFSWPESNCELFHNKWRHSCYQSRDSLISQLIMYDFLVSGQETHNMNISNELMRICLTAGTQYNKALEENRKKKVITEKEEKKKKIDHEIGDFETN